MSAKRHSRGGQVMLFLLIALTALVFMLLFNVDMHRIIQRKNQAQNAGDAAALAAARWQGSTLNLIGELNLFHVLALVNQSPDAVDAITNMQARLCFTGPMTGLFAAQIAAKNNHIYVDSQMTQLLRDHISTIRNTYANSASGNMYFTEPWPGAWGDYADMLTQVIADGISAGPDNAQFFLEPSGGHVLLDKSFYQAVNGQNWCWFHLYERGLLESYSTYSSWPPLPDPDASQYGDSEIFGLGLRPYMTTLRNHFPDPETLADHMKEAGIDGISAAQLAVTNVMEAAEFFYFYNPSEWGSWSRIEPDDGFPVTGRVREEYDYAGADAAVRVYATVDRITTGENNAKLTDTVVWTAAAKPFGYLDIDGQKELPTSASNFVLPAFRNVRLIPIDAASGSENSSADSDWMYHIRGHLQSYLSNGPKEKEEDTTCRYCKALVRWEKEDFRETGRLWLELYNHTCRIPSGGGNRRGGGSRRGH